MQIKILGKTVLEARREKSMPKPKYAISTKRWDKMFAQTIEENRLKDLRQDQSVSDAAFALTRGTISSPLTNVGKYLLGRAFLTNDSAKLGEAKNFIEKHWPGQWQTVVQEVDLWLNPKIEKPKPHVDERKYTLPCSHKTYHLDAGPRGLIQCYQTGCGKRFRVSTDKTGKVSLTEYMGGAVGA